MAILVLVRHGRTTANATGVLAGRAAGVRLDDRGRAQATACAERLAAVPLSRVVTSPLTRCQETTRAITAAQATPPVPVVERGLTECDYGSWQGRPLKELAREKLWRTVQQQPSAAGFPGGETLGEMQARAVTAVRRHEAAVTQEHGASAVWAVVSHGDIIKSILADALGMHLDLFQRLQVDPASVSIVHYTADRPYVLAVNTQAGDLSWLAGRRRAPRGAAVGGGAGPSGGRSDRERRGRVADPG